MDIRKMHPEEVHLLGELDRTERVSQYYRIGQHGRLAGFVVYPRNLTEDMARLALLHVSRDFRGEGIGTMLINRAYEKARIDGKKRIYVSSCPSRNTVDFYMRKGFSLADEPNRELFEMEPEDIHMIMEMK